MNAAYREYLESNHWKNLRRLRLEKSNYRCDNCGSAFRLQVHHIRYRHLYDVSVNDLKTVCDYCHAKEHGIAVSFRPIRPNTKELLKDQFNKPIRGVKPWFKHRKDNRMTPEQIREQIKRNKENQKEIPELTKKQLAWLKSDQLSGRA